MKDGKQWWKLSASIDEPAATSVAGPDPEKAKAALDNLRKEATDLNAKWSAYAFAPGDYKARNINNTLDDLLNDARRPGHTPALKLKYATTVVAVNPRWLRTRSVPR